MKTYFGKKDMASAVDSFKAYGIRQTIHEGELAFDDDMMVVFYSGANRPSVTQYPSTHLDANSLQNAIGIDLTNITDLKLPCNIETIDPHAFDDMTNLTALTFPYTTKVRAIAEDTFKDCQNLKSLKLGSGISKLESGAFQNATSLETLHIPFSLEYIDSTALENAPAEMKCIQFVESHIAKFGKDANDELFEFERNLVENRQLSNFVSFLSKHLKDFKTIDENSFSYSIATKPDANQSQQDNNAQLLKSNLGWQTYMNGRITVLRLPLLGYVEEHQTVPLMYNVHNTGHDNPYPNPPTPCSNTPLPPVYIPVSARDTYDYIDMTINGNPPQIATNNSDDHLIWTYNELMHELEMEKGQHDYDKEQAEKACKEKVADDLAKKIQELQEHANDNKTCSRCS